MAHINHVAGPSRKLDVQEDPGLVGTWEVLRNGVLIPVLLLLRLLARAPVVGVGQPPNQIQRAAMHGRNHERRMLKRRFQRNERPMSRQRRKQPSRIPLTRALLLQRQLRLSQADIWIKIISFSRLTAWFPISGGGGVFPWHLTHITLLYFIYSGFSRPYA